MAGGVFTDEKGQSRAHLYEYKITPYFIFACIVGSLGGSLFGYDLGVSGGVTSMDDFLKEFFPKVYKRSQEHHNETDYCKYEDEILTLFTSSLYYAALVVTPLASQVTRRWGRRGSILVGSVSFFAGGLMNAFAKNVTTLIIGRCLLGFGIGFGNQSVPLYLSEMAPAKIRGMINQLFQLTTCLGILVANLINYAIQHIHPWGWRLSLGLAILPATCMFVGGLFLPETPNSLVEQGKLDQARKVLEKVRGTKNVDAEFADLIDASNAAQAVKHPFRNLLKRKNRPQLIIGALAIPAFQQLTGNNSILFYAPVIFRSLGFASNASLYSSVISNGALVLAALISMFLVDKFGRRAFFLEAGAEMIICMVAVGITLGVKFGNGKHTAHFSAPVSAFLVIMIFLFVLAYGRSWGPLGWLVPSEIFPLETRSAGQAIVVSVNMLFTALVAQFFLGALCFFKFGIFLIFAGLIITMSCFVYFLLPETKQVPIEEIYLLWETHPVWKKYCKPENDKKGTEMDQRPEQ